MNEDFNLGRPQTCKGFILVSRDYKESYLRV
jgi:hypothetical protein